MSERLANDAVVDRAVEALRAQRAELGEVFFRESETSSVEIKDGAIENVLAHGERGVGVRVIDSARAGFAYTSDLSPAGIEECVSSARAMAKVTEPDPELRIATWRADTADLGIYEPPRERTLEERARPAFDAERAARAYDPRVSGFRKTTAFEGELETILATTAGTRGSYREAWYGVSTSAIATEGDERQVGYHGVAARRAGEVDSDGVGRRAAEMAVGKLGARSLPTQRIPVVLGPYEGMALLGAIAPLFSAENVLKGKSLFAGKLGERVASTKVGIVDDARLRGGLRSAPFDGEGTTTRRRALVERGTLAGYLTSLKTASKVGTEPTGNARRGSYSAPSRIGPSNFFIEAGDEDPAAMVARLDRALRITSLLNLHTVDPISGEFSLGAAGDLLERGERRYPVQGITIAGNLTALLSAISAVGRDLTFGGSGIGSPTLVVSELSVGGT
ncbi:MAG TPA: TldD/PmbA family protein [Candidatus Limnocylindria bacterium]|nr:TldD/PmbA family protein [Candidatus Limnocylindria bacterium]